MTSQEREEWRQKHSGGFVTGSPISNFSCSKVKLAYPSQAIRTNPGAHSPDFFLPFIYFYMCGFTFPLHLFSIQNKWQPVTNSNLKPCIFNKYSLKLCCMCLNLNVHIHLFLFICHMFPEVFFLMCVFLPSLYSQREQFCFLYLGKACKPVGVELQQNFLLYSKFCIVCQSISHKNPEIQSLRGKEGNKHQKEVGSTFEPYSTPLFLLH